MREGSNQMNKKLLLAALKRACTVTPRSVRTKPAIRRCALYYRDGSRAWILAFSDVIEKDHNHWPKVMLRIEVGPDDSPPDCLAMLVHEAATAVRKSELDDLHPIAEKAYDVRALDDYDSSRAPAASWMRSIDEYDRPPVAALAACANVFYLAACLGPALEAASLKPDLLAAQPLGHLIDAVAHAVSQDETRTTLNGIFIEPLDGGRARAVATDGHRLTLADTEWAHLPELTTYTPERDQSGITLPLLGAEVLRDLIGKREKWVWWAIEPNRGHRTIQIESTYRSPSSWGGMATRSYGRDLSNPRHLVATVGTATVTMRIDRDGIFPPYDQVVPKKFLRSVTINRQVLLKELLRLDAKEGRSRSRSVEIRLNTNSIYLSYETHKPDGDPGPYRSVHVPASCSAQGEFACAINAGYLAEALSAMQTDLVKMEFGDSLAPMKITSNDRSSFTVIMPVRM